MLPTSLPNVNVPRRFANTEGFTTTSGIILVNQNEPYPSKLKPMFFNKSIGFSIEPKMIGSDDFDYKNKTSVYLGFSKAMILRNALRKFIDHELPEGCQNIMVATNKGIVGFDYGQSFGLDSPCLFVSNINPETKEIIKTMIYVIKTNNYDYGINFDITSNQYDVIDEYSKTIELETIYNLIDQYVKNVNGALAHSVLEANNFYGTQKSLNSIKQALNLPIGNNNQKFNGESTNGGYSGGRNRTTYGSIEDAALY